MESTHCRALAGAGETTQTLMLQEQASNILGKEAGQSVESELGPHMLDRKSQLRETRLLAVRVKKGQPGQGTT